MDLNKIWRSLFFLFGLQINAFAQDTVLINFDVDYKFVDSNGHSFLKLITLPQWKLMYSGEKYEIKFPENFNVKDSAIALEYFTGWKNAKINNETPLLIGNYSSPTPIVYVDYNNNLNFGDDGQPVKFGSDSTANVYLQNSDNPMAYFPIYYYRYKIEGENREMIIKFFGGEGPNSKNKGMTNMDYWFATKRINHRTANTWINGNNIKIGLYDYNCNGLYNDKGEDRIMMGDYDKNTISGRLEKGAVVYTDTTQILLGGEIYEVLEISQTGTFIKLLKSKKRYFKPIGAGDTIPNFEVELLSDERKMFADIKDKNKFTLLDFWGSWCLGCTQQLPMLQEIAEKYKNKLQLIGFNHGDAKETIPKYIAKHNVSWQQAIASEQIITDLLIDAYPNYLLIDANGKIVLMHGSIVDIEKILKQ